MTLTVDGADAEQVDAGVSPIAEPPEDAPRPAATYSTTSSVV